MGTLALLLWASAAACLLCAVGVVALIKLPKPVPSRWEVRLFLLMGMPADQFLAFVIKVRKPWIGLGVTGPDGSGLCMFVWVELELELWCLGWWGGERDATQPAIRD